MNAQYDNKNYEKKKVSVIITTYKRNVDILERAIRSVANQKYKNFELIVVNDNPTDKVLSTKIENTLKKYNNLDYKYILTNKNEGACKARNLGIDNSLGYYIAFLDDDDEWLEDKLTLQVDAFKNKNNLGIVYCNAIIIDDDKKTKKNRFKEEQPSGCIYEEILSKNIIGSCSFPMFPKKILKEFNGFREDMPAMQDWELYLRITKKYKCFYISKPLAIYHKYKGERISKNYENRIIAHKNIEKEFGEDIKKSKNALYCFYIGKCNVYLANNQKRVALNYLKKAFFLKPLCVKNNTKTFIKFIVSFFVEGNRL